MTSNEREEGARIRGVQSIACECYVQRQQDHDLRDCPVHCGVYAPDQTHMRIPGHGSHLLIQQGDRFSTRID